MKSISGKDFSKILLFNGWELARINGSHHIYIKKGRVERLSVPIHGNDDLKIGLLKHLLKIAEINETEL
jgi:predicted RNA binding protein YcfA (HicA-like mRNA interferase family)